VTQGPRAEDPADGEFGPAGAADTPLDGIRVLDVSTILAGPLACQLLGDFGAEVIKVEHPTHGDGMRGHGHTKGGVPLWWKELSRNKRCVGLYLGDEEARDVFLELVATADVMVENFRPGTLERWGLGFDRLREVNPRLILTRISGFGQRGPYATRAGFGTLAEAMSGFAHLTGQPDGPPTLPAFGLADSITGLAAANATLMALYHRDLRGGGGQEIDVSILEPMMLAVGPGPTYYDQLGVVQQRQGNRSSNNAPRNTYRTKDDHWVAVSTSADRIAERVMRLVGHPEVIDEPWFATGGQRAEHADLLDEYVGGWIAERTRQEVIDLFEEAGAAVAPIYSPDELLDDPQVRALDMLPEVPDEDLGALRMHNVLFRLSDTPGRILWTGRELGADTEEILVRELGVDAQVYEDLKERGLVA
jgi:crotonobetainyl-CoA:carnitine CoA-transferase CaiB-like acyl-CoA transferase